MFKVTKLITLSTKASESERDMLLKSLRSASQPSDHVLRARLERTGPGHVVNGGDWIWHVQFVNEEAFRAWTEDSCCREAARALSDETVVHVDSAAYQQGWLNVGEPAITNGIHRTLLLSIRTAITAEKVRQFEVEMTEMARYLPVIRNWGLSRVIDGTGSRRWSHVWEQDFRHTDELNGPYMFHPVHFGHIDRWFDPESHDWIVDTELCHTFCLSERSMLAPPTGAANLG